MEVRVSLAWWTEREREREKEKRNDLNLLPDQLESCLGKGVLPCLVRPVMQFESDLPLPPAQERAQSTLSDLSPHHQRQRSP